MYNGIGLTTPRGSGTNGYIQSSKFFVKPKTNRVSDATKPFEAGQGTAGLTTKKPNKDILEHDRKRQIELKIAILEDKLTEQGYTESEIAEKLVEARKALEAQQDKDEEEGEVIPTPTHQKKVSDTQTHQIAARKEKQMETFRAALGIGLSDSALPPLPNNRKNSDDNKREHAFLDRDPPVTAAVDVDDLKVKADKKKGEAIGDEIDESRLRKKKKEKKRSRRHVHDSDTDTDSSEEHLRRSTRKKKSRRGYSETDSDDFASGRKQRKSAKKNSRRRSVDSDDSYSDSDTDNDETGKRDIHRSKSSRRRHDSSEDDSDTDGGREKKRGEVQKRKIELIRSQRRGKDSMSSESDSDADRARDRKKETVKKGSHRHDSSEDDSDIDGGRANNSGEVRRRKIELKGSQRRGRDNVDSESDSDADRGRDHKKETVKKGRNRYDTEDNSDSDIVSDEKVEKSRRIGRRHDSDDKDSTPSHGRKSGKAPAPREGAARRRSVSLTDDSDTSSSDDDSDSSNLKHQINDKKNVVDTRGVRGSPQSSQEEKGFASGAAKKDDRRRRTLNEDDRLEGNREMKGKRKLDDEYHDKGPESKSRSRNLGREVEHRRDNLKDAKFDSESNARAYREKDDRKRDDYSRWEKDDQKKDDYSKSVRTGGEFDGDNGRQDGRIQSKRSETHRGSRRNDWDYEAGRGGGRHGWDEEEPCGREHRRDEIDHKYRSHRRDEEEPRGREHERDEMGHKYRSYGRDDRRQRKGEEDNRGNKGHVRDRKLDHSDKMAYDDARSSERRSRRHEQR
ncbi:hypothetical protein DITRI_Ditri09bG0071900 [Diplodiscus trichospermus]